MNGVFIASIAWDFGKCFGIKSPGAMLYFRSRGLIFPCNAMFKMSWSGYLSSALMFFSSSMFFVCSFVFINNTPLLKYDRFLGVFLQSLRRRFRLGCSGLRVVPCLGQRRLYILKYLYYIVRISRSGLVCLNQGIVIF